MGKVLLQTKASRIASESLVSNSLLMTNSALSLLNASMTIGDNATITSGQKLVVEGNVKVLANGSASFVTEFPTPVNLASLGSSTAYFNTFSCPASITGSTSSNNAAVTTYIDSPDGSNASTALQVTGNTSFGGNILMKHPQVGFLTMNNRNIDFSGPPARNMLNLWTNSNQVSGFNRDDFNHTYSIGVVSDNLALCMPTDTLTGGNVFEFRAGTSSFGKIDTKGIFTSPSVGVLRHTELIPHVPFNGNSDLASISYSSSVINPTTGRALDIGTGAVYTYTPSVSSWAVNQNYTLVITAYCRYQTEATSQADRVYLQMTVNGVDLWHGYQYQSWGTSPETTAGDNRRRSGIILPITGSYSGASGTGPVTIGFKLLGEFFSSANITFYKPFQLYIEEYTR